MEIWFQLAAVAGVLLLLAATLWCLRRRGYAALAGLRRERNRKLECLERIGLGPQHALHLVRLGDRVLLVASSPSGCALIHSGPCRDLELSAEALQ